MSVGELTRCFVETYMQQHVPSLNISIEGRSLLHVDVTFRRRLVSTQNAFVFPIYSILQSVLIFFCLISTLRGPD